jgi:MATH domain/Ankyrin repeats (3 copies)
VKTLFGFTLSLLWKIQAMRWRDEAGSEPHNNSDDAARRTSSLDEDEADSSSSPDVNSSSPGDTRHSNHHRRLEAAQDREDGGDGTDDGAADRQNVGTAAASDQEMQQQHKQLKEETDPPDKDSNSGESGDGGGGDHAEDEPPGVPWTPQTVQSTCEFTHTIANYAQQRESGCKKAEYSETTVDEFGNRWRLIIYVNGNGRASNHHLSLFLQVADADDLPFGWKKAVSYVLTLEHPKGGSFSYAKRNPDKTFKLCPKAIDWGWSQFITSDRIQQEGFVANDSLTVRASVTVKSSSVSIEEEDAELYLKCAVEEGDAASVKLCLDQGASVNCKFKDDLYTPLHTACSSGTSKGSIDVLNLLLVEGADPNACNKWRETPLLIAANNGHIAACEALLEHGADPSLCSEAGWSALTFAAHKVRSLELETAPIGTPVTLHF